MADVDLTRVRATDALRDTDRVSVGVVRILSSIAGTPGEEREFETGDEALVEQGLAEWVVAPVHSALAGRRLDTDAEREATPLGGVEAYPPAASTPQRRSEAREKGFVDANTDEGLAEKLAAKRVEVTKALGDEDADGVRTQAELGGLGARSGPATAHSDLAADKALRAGAAATGDVEESKKAQGDSKADPAAAKQAK